MAGDSLPDGVVIIYGLTDPVTHELRYVGKTQYRLDKRRKQHINHSKNLRLAAWVDGLRSQNCLPEIFEIEMVSTAGWQEAEVFWISYFRSIGCGLVNAHEGGGASVKHTAETLAVIAEKRAAWHADPTNIERLRQKSLAAWSDPQTKARMLSAQKAAITPDLRQRRSELKRRDWAENPNFRFELRCGAGKSR